MLKGMERALWLVSVSVIEKRSKPLAIGNWIITQKGRPEGPLCMSMHSSVVGSMKTFNSIGLGGGGSHLDSYLPVVSQQDAKLVASQALIAGNVFGWMQGMRAGNTDPVTGHHYPVLWNHRAFSKYVCNNYRIYFLSCFSGICLLPRGNQDSLSCPGLCGSVGWAASVLCTKRSLIQLLVRTHTLVALWVGSP